MGHVCDTFLLRLQELEMWKEWLVKDRAMVAEKNAEANKKSGKIDTKAAPQAPNAFDRLFCFCSYFLGLFLRPIPRPPRKHPTYFIVT